MFADFVEFTLNGCTVCINRTQVSSVKTIPQYEYNVEQYNHPTLYQNIAPPRPARTIYKGLEIRFASGYSTNNPALFAQYVFSTPEEALRIKDLIKNGE